MTPELLHTALILAAAFALTALAAAICVIPAEILHRRQMRRNAAFRVWLAAQQPEIDRLMADEAAE
jgi:hypothetical protein